MSKSARKKHSFVQEDYPEPIADLIACIWDDGIYCDYCTKRDALYITGVELSRNGLNTHSSLIGTSCKRCRKVYGETGWSYPFEYY